MSASTSNTRWLACAKASARLLDTTVLPSPGPVLVTTIVRLPSSTDENSTFVRMVRKASPEDGGTPVVTRGAPPVTFLSGGAGTRATHRLRRCVVISSGD